MDAAAFLVQDYIVSFPERVDSDIVLVTEEKKDEHFVAQRLFRKMAQDASMDVGKLQHQIHKSHDVQTIAHRWLEEGGRLSVRERDQKEMDALDTEIEHLHSSCLPDLAIGELGHHVGHLFGEKWGFVVETLGGGLVKPSSLSQNPVRDRFTESGAHAAMIGVGEVVLAGVVPEGFLAHRILVGVDALAQGAEVVQSNIRTFRTEHFDASAHEPVLSCLEGGCLTPYQSAIAMEKLADVVKGPGEAAHAAHHFLAEQSRKALDAVGLTDKNVATFVQNVERIDAMVDEAPFADRP